MLKSTSEGLSSVAKEISDSDDMYQGNLDHYFDVGQSAFTCIESAMHLAGKSNSDIKRILDFPCGYGRVLRVLSTAFPGSEITACDLEPGAVDFCEDKFNAIPVHSSKNLDSIELQAGFDLIWVGSLLTHVQEEAFEKFIDFFSELLSDGGVLVFTAQGRYSEHLLRSGESSYGLETQGKIDALLNSYDETGFGFADYSHSDDYGISLSKPSYVLRLLEKRNDLRVLMSLEKGWDNHQDVYGCMKLVA